MIVFLREIITLFRQLFKERTLRIVEFEYISPAPLPVMYDSKTGKELTVAELGEYLDLEEDVAAQDSPTAENPEMAGPTGIWHRARRSGICYEACGIKYGLFQEPSRKGN